MAEGSQDEGDWPLPARAHGDRYVSRESWIQTAGGHSHTWPGIEPYTLGFLGKILGWSETECKIMIAKVREEVRDKSLHMYIRFYFVYGRKPESAAH
jgi:hypothetical protein